MSLEEAIKANTAAIERQTAVLEKMLSAGAGKPAADKPASKPAADKPAEKPAPKPAAKTEKRKGEMTVEDVADRVKTFLKTGDEDTRARRKTEVRQIMDHYGVERFTAIDPASFEEALGFLKQFEDGEDPFGSDGGVEADEDESMV